MTRLAIDPARAAAEMAEFCDRIARGSGRLAALDLQGEGCSARDAVFRIDKSVLWRYQPLAPDAGLPPLVIAYALVRVVDWLQHRRPERAVLRRPVAFVAAILVVISMGVLTWKG